MKLDRKQDHYVLYRVFFGPIEKISWLPGPLISWDIFYFSSETAEQNSTSSTKFVFSGRSEKRDDRSGLWLADTYLTFHLKLLNEYQRNLAESKNSTSSTKFVFFSDRSANKTGDPSQSVTKLTHCTQVHNMWPFGSLVLIFYPQNGENLKHQP